MQSLFKTCARLSSAKAMQHHSAHEAWCGLLDAVKSTLGFRVEGQQNVPRNLAPLWASQSL